jgi:hypothetical protein
MLVTATQHAVHDARFADRRCNSSSPVAVTVSLLHDRERHESAGVGYIAWKLRAGRDSFSVHEGNRWAVFLDSVVPHYGVSGRGNAVKGPGQLVLVRSAFQGGILAFGEVGPLAC